MTLQNFALRSGTMPRFDGDHDRQASLRSSIKETLFSPATSDTILLHTIAHASEGYFRIAHLVTPQSILVVGGERVDDDRDGQRQDEDATQGAESTWKLRENMSQNDNSFRVHL